MPTSTRCGIALALAAALAAEDGPPTRRGDLRFEAGLDPTSYHLDGQQASVAWAARAGLTYVRAVAGGWIAGGELAYSRTCDCRPAIPRFTSIILGGLGGYAWSFASAPRLHVETALALSLVHTSMQPDVASAGTGYAADLRLGAGWTLRSRIQLGVELRYGHTATGDLRLDGTSEIGYVGYRF